LRSINGPDQWPRPQILAIQEQQIEHEIDQPFAGFARVLDQVERRAAIRKDATKFAVGSGFARGHAWHALDSRRA
jgi:hypothetical protein